MKHSKSYIEMAKQLSVHEKHHQTKQGRQHQISKGLEDWKESPLDREQVEELFWKTLVHYGWKQQTQQYRVDLVLPCPMCEEPVMIYPLITASEAHFIVQPEYAAKLINSHTCKSEA